MKKTGMFYLISVICFYGCYSEKADLKRHGLWVGYVPGPFFHYGQTTLAESRHFDLGDIPPQVRTITAAIPFSNRGITLFFDFKVTQSN